MNSIQTMNEKTKTWRQEIRNLVGRYDRIHFYSADPGATAIMRPIHEEAHKTGKANTWFVEGWAAHAYLPGERYISGEREFFNAKPFAEKQVVIMGQQVNFERAYSRLKYLKEAGIETVFVSDHWKNIAKTFKPAEDAAIFLPDHFYVPDQFAYDVQIQSLLAHGLNRADVENALEIFVNVGVEQSAELIAAVPPDELRQLKNRYKSRGMTIVMMLDCIQDEEKKILGFDWKSALDQAVTHFQSCYKNGKLLIKPHPRQDLGEVEEYISQYGLGISLELVKEPKGEPFIALADEVWGITTILLAVALRVGKPIKVFMPERTREGERESNAHIEPYLVK